MHLECTCAKWRVCAAPNGAPGSLRQLVIQSGPKEANTMSQAARTVDEDAKFRRVCDVVAEEMRERPIPGVVVGVLRGDSMSIRGFGVTSVEHSLPVDAATLCQIGS